MLQSIISKAHALLSRTHLDGDVWRSMLKGSIPPTAALWLIQSNTAEATFDFVGYLPVIITIIESPMLPRVQFMRTIAFTCVLNCIVACVCLLAGFCSVQARLHTTETAGDLLAYNSSAAAVSALWLLFAVWALHTFRAFQVQHLGSVIVCTIYTVVSILISTRADTMSSVITLNLQLIQSFFVAHGLCTFTNLLIFPKTSRRLFFDGVQNLLKLTGNVASTEKDFLIALAGAIDPLHERQEQSDPKPSSHASEKEPSKTLVSSLESVRSARIDMSQTFAKLQNDLSFAKKDVGWSTLTIEDLNTMVHNFRGLMLSLRGIVALGTVFKSICEWRHWTTLFDTAKNSTDSSEWTAPDDTIEQQEWKAIFGNAAELFSDIQALVNDGLEHALVSLRRITRVQFSVFMSWSSSTSGNTDPEKMQQDIPGGRRFVENFNTRERLLRTRVGTMLEKWKKHGELERTESRDISFKKMLTREHRPQGAKYQDRYYREQQQLLIVLYIEYLMHEILRTLSDLVLFFDEKRLHKELEGRTLIWPGSRRVWKTVLGIFSTDQNDAGAESMESEEVPPTLEFGKSYGMGRINLEHLPPKNWAQSVLSKVAKAYSIIGSHQSFYGFRVACAVLSVTLIAFLRPTQTWFFNRRGLWAAVFIPFSMAPSSGEAFTLLWFRIIGSIMALVLSFINWYIVDGIPAGVIVFFFIITFVQQYLVVHYPQYGSIWRPSIITLAIIIGYELQIRHTHIALPPATESQDFPVYLIGPYRFICVVIGVTVAFVWTIFPCPISAASVMRKRLGRAMFILAEYHSCMHSTVMSWTDGHQKLINHKGRTITAALYFNKIQHKLFVKETSVLTMIRNQARFSGFEPTIGGSFPREQYMNLVKEIDLIIAYTNIVIFAATCLPLDMQYPQRHKPSMTGPQTTDTSSLGKASEWNTSLGQLVRRCSTESTRITAMLCLIASTISNMQPLPPNLQAPEPFYVSKQMQKLRPELMTLEHASEPGYSAFAVIEVSATMLAESLGRMLSIVKELAGELHFDIEPQLAS